MAQAGNIKTKGGKWFKKIPKEQLFGPGGMILLLFAVIMEVLDPIIPGGSMTVEMIPEIIFMVLLYFVAKVPLRSLIIPFLIERAPILSDILPTWVIRMLM